MGTELKRWVSVLWVKVGVVKSYPKRNMKLETRNYPSNYPVLPLLLAASCQSLPWTASPLKAIIESQTVADSQKVH